MSRIKWNEAMHYLGLSRDSFKEWCLTVKLKAHYYEFSTRQYFISGEFYAFADMEEIRKIKEIHGERWGEYYEKYFDVRAFLANENEHQYSVSNNYIPKSSRVESFMNKLKNEKS